MIIYFIEGRLDESAVIQSPHLIGNWQEGGSTFLFFSQPAPEAVDSLMARHPDLVLSDVIRMSYADWQGGFVDPLRVGAFRIIPPWCREPEEPSIKTFNGNGSCRDLLLDPGVVFGNGGHTTTHDCLEAIEAAADAPALALDSVLDLGTGTGLLALAAARCGSRRVLAVDDNFLSARTARDNIRLNNLEERIAVIQADAVDCAAFPADLVIANIHFDVLHRLIQQDGFWRKRGFILSGLLRSQAAQIRARLEQNGAVIMRAWTSDDIWHTFLGRTPVGGAAC